MRSNQIKVPERGPDEPDASPMQLQFIRQLVEGTSMTGFRFDYRKLGEQQAASVIEQLMAIRDASRVPVQTHTGPGCLGAVGLFIKRLGTVVIVLLVLSAIGGGIFIYYSVQKGDFKTYLESMGLSAGKEITGEDPDTPDNPDASTGGDKRVDSLFFEGLKVDKNPDDRQPPRPPTTDDPDPQGPGGIIADPTPAPEPTLTPEIRKQIGELELMLVKLKHFTDTDYAQPYRVESVKAMKRNLSTWSGAVELIESADPALASRIRALVESYDASEIDGERIRKEVDSIREEITTIKSAE